MPSTLRNPADTHAASPRNPACRRSYPRKPPLPIVAIDNENSREASAQEGPCASHGWTARSTAGGAKGVLPPREGHMEREGRELAVHQPLVLPLVWRCSSPVRLNSCAPSRSRHHTGTGPCSENRSLGDASARRKLRRLTWYASTEGPGGTARSIDVALPQDNRLSS